MTSVVENLNTNEKIVVSKGAPEIMKNLYSQETIPDNYDEILKQLGEQGFRILALGHKKIESINEEIE